MNVTNGTSIALGHHDFAMQDTSGNIHYDRVPKNDSRVGTHQSVHNISQVLLHPLTEEHGVMRELTLALDLYYTPGIIAIGITSNIYTSFVLRNSRFQSFSVASYLTALCVCDTAYLVAKIFIWLQSVHGIQIVCTNGIYQIVWYTIHVTNFLSIWYVLCIQIDRYINMWHPTKAQRRVSTKQACWISSLLSVVAALIYSLVLWTTGSYKEKATGNYVCNFLPKYLEVVKIFIKVDVFVAILMPYTMLPILNMLIFLQVYIKRNSLQKYKKPSKSKGIRSKRIMGYVKITKKHIHITLSMLLISSLLWGLNALHQWIIVRDFFKFSSSESDLTSKRRYRNVSLVTWIIAQHLYELSFAIKLLVYLIFSALFRSSVVECCRSYKCICAQSNANDDAVSTCDYWDDHTSCEGSLSPTEAKPQDLTSPQSIKLVHSEESLVSNHLATSIIIEPEIRDTTV